jgi:hypothetical protein
METLSVQTTEEEGVAGRHRQRQVGDPRAFRTHSACGPYRLFRAQSIRMRAGRPNLSKWPLQWWGDFGGIGVDGVQRYYRRTRVVGTCGTRPDRHARDP